MKQQGTSTFINALRNIIREELRTVIKQELTEILKEGLQSTITEMKHKPEVKSVAKQKSMFNENRYADILNNTSAIQEQHNPLQSYAELMSEGIEELKFTSRDAQAFPMMRQTTKSVSTNTVPAVMHDPETGKDFEVKPEVASAMTRDYSALMKAIESKKKK